MPKELTGNLSQLYKNRQRLHKKSYNKERVNLTSKQTKGAYDA